jgi:hypothetical protein
MKFKVKFHLYIEILMADDEVFDISKIEFGVLSAKEIEKLAVCQIDSNQVTGPT